MSDPLLLPHLTPVTGDTKRQLQQMCLRLTGTEAGSEVRFPGSQPVSFESRNFETITGKPYFAAEKTDGVRYMMLLCPRGAFMVDRNFELRKLPVAHFPTRGGASDAQLDKTLLDGELVQDDVVQRDGTRTQLKRFATRRPKPAAPAFDLDRALAAF